MTHIAIIGAGFCGSLLAVHLLRLARQPLRISLIDPSPDRGAGMPYATPSRSHLLNVRTVNMSAFPDDPGHFVRWLHSRFGVSAPGEEDYVPRALYGDYLRDILAQARTQAPAFATLQDVFATAVDVREEGDKVLVHLDDGQIIEAASVALCLGNFAPSPPAGLSPAVLGSPRFVNDPWDFDRVARLPQDGSVFLLGSGLTMVDAVLTLEDAGHPGPFLSLSRHGLRPLPHPPRRPDTVDQLALPETVTGLLRRLRQQAETAAWPAVVDSLRPHTQSLWRSLSAAERRRFLRHARPFWDIHRHRIAPAVADRVTALEGSGRLSIAAGRLISADVQEGKLVVELRYRGESQGRTITAAAMINCTGPERDLSSILNPLLRTLYQRGMVRADLLRLGIDVTAEGVPVDSEGAASRRLVVAGPLTIPALWENIAVPDLRRQVADAARRLLDAETKYSIKSNLAVLCGVVEKDKATQEAGDGEIPDDADGGGASRA